MSDKKPVVFMIMPFDDDHMALYDKLKEEFCSKYDLIHAGDLDNQQNILRDIARGICEADVIIADLTGLNANVFYELGLAHAINKKVIIITQDITELPFDIKSYRANEYSLLFYKMPDFIVKLNKLLDDAVSNRISFGNPISDFVPGYFEVNHLAENTGRVKMDSSVNAEESSNDDGLIDYIKSILDNSQIVANELSTMNNEVDLLNYDISRKSSEINRVNAKRSNVDTNYIKNVCRSLSEPISRFAEELKGHVLSISEAWETIEENYLLLLDNRFIQSDDNIIEIKKGLKELPGIKAVFIKSSKDVGVVANSVQGFKGLERRLNRAANSLLEELSGYNNMSDTICSSIDRIIGKAYVVFESDFIESADRVSE